MERLRQRADRLIVLFSLSFIVAFSGCAGVTKPALMTQGEADALNARLGTIGVVSATFIPKTYLKTPAKGALAGMGKGAGAGGSIMLDGAKGSSSPGDALLGIVLLPVGATVGAVAGAVMADSAKDVSDRESAIRTAVSELRMQEAMREKFVGGATAVPAFKFASVEGSGPAAAGASADYRPLVEKGIKTVQEMTVEEFGLDGKGEIQPDLSMYMMLKVRLVNVADNKEVFSRVFLYRGKEHKFAEWAADGAGLFKAEIDGAYFKLSEDARKEIYMLDTLMKSCRLGCGSIATQQIP